MLHRSVFLTFVAMMSAEAFSQPLQSPPIFKTGVDLVRMDVRITGADGMPIKDRRVTIRVTRRAARVSTRTGYTLELSDRSPAARRQIDTAFAAPFPEQGLPATFVDSTLVSAHLALADAYVQLGQRALAIQAVRAGLTALPASPELIDKLSRLEAR